MNEREKLVIRYKKELSKYFQLEGNEELIREIVIGCGPSVYKKDASIVSSSDDSEIERLKTNFLVEKLGLSEELDLDSAISEVLDKYGKTNRRKYRVVVYYMLVMHFGKEEIYLDNKQ